MYRLTGYKNSLFFQKEILHHRDVYERQLATGCQSVFESNNDFLPAYFEFNTLTAGTGSCVRNDEGSFNELKVLTSGDRVIQQSRYYLPYQLLITRTTFCACTPIVTMGTVSNYTVKIGVFDDHYDKTTGRLGGDGYFFMVQGGKFYFVCRSSVDSYQTDTLVEQSNWNNDKLDGTGYSKLTFSPYVMTCVAVEDSCADIGIVRVGFIIDGQLIYAHNFVPSSNRTKPVVKTARLPIRYEIQCVSGSTPASLYQTACSSFSHTSLYMSRGIRFSCTSPVPVRVSNGPVISLRCKSSCNRSTIFPKRLEILCLNYETPMVWTLVLNGTLTGANFQELNICSVSEIDVSATAISGGVPTLSGLISRGSGSMQIPACEAFQSVGSAISGTADVVTVVVKSISTGYIDIMATLEFLEDR